MRKSTIFLLAFFSILLCGCSAEGTANKALKELGSGKFAEVLGFNEQKILMFGGKSIYSDIEAENSFAESGIVDNNLRYLLINTELLFSKFELVSSIEQKIKVYNTSRKPREKNAVLRTYEFLKNIDKKNEEFKIHFDSANNEIGYSYLEYKDVPLFILRYKIEDTQLAEIHVIKHPENGYKVTYFQRIK